MNFKIFDRTRKSEETKKKMSKVRKQKFKEGYINPMKGRHQTEENKERQKKLAIKQNQPKCKYNGRFTNNELSKK